MEELRYVSMADDIQELASISAVMLDQFTTFNMTGWHPRSGSDEFNTLRLLRRNGRFLLRVVDKRHRIVADIVLNDVVSYVIKVRCHLSLVVTRNGGMMELGPTFFLVYISRPVASHFYFA